MLSLSSRASSGRSRHLKHPESAMPPPERKATVVRLARRSDTESLARRVAGQLNGGELLLLSGDLGAGKTTFVRYLAGALGINPSWVSSPSFTLVQQYPAGERGVGITHVDLYRLAPGEDLEPLGLEDALGSQDLVVVEWPEAARKFLEESGRPIVSISFSYDRKSGREARVTGPCTVAGSVRGK